MILKLLHILSFSIYIGTLLSIYTLFIFQNRTKESILIKVQKSIHFYLALPSLVVLSISGIWLAVINFSVMKSDWFYLKIFLLFPFFILFFHATTIISGNKIEQYEYNDSFFKNFTIVFLLIVTLITYLAIFKPL